MKDIKVVPVEELHQSICTYINDKDIVIGDYNDMKAAVLNMIRAGYMFNMDRDRLRDALEDITFMLCPDDDANKDRVARGLEWEEEEDDDDSDDDSEYDENDLQNIMQMQQMMRMMGGAGPGGPGGSVGPADDDAENSADDDEPTAEAVEEVVEEAVDEVSSDKSVEETPSETTETVVENDVEIEDIEKLRAKNK
jgi:hypothetical protein